MEWNFFHSFITKFILESFIFVFIYFFCGIDRINGIRHSTSFYSKDQDQQSSSSLFVSPSCVKFLKVAKEANEIEKSRMKKNNTSLRKHYTRMHMLSSIFSPQLSLSSIVFRRFNFKNSLSLLSPFCYSFVLSLKYDLNGKLPH